MASTATRPAGGAEGPDSVAFKASDLDGESNTARFALTVADLDDGKGDPLAYLRAYPDALRDLNAAFKAAGPKASDTEAEALARLARVAARAGRRFERERAAALCHGKPLAQRLARLWAYGRTYQSSAERTAGLVPWLEHNFRRPHGSLGHKPPGSRLTKVVGNDS